MAEQLTAEQKKKNHEAFRKEFEDAYYTSAEKKAAKKAAEADPTK